MVARWNTFMAVARLRMALFTLVVLQLQRCTCGSLNLEGLALLSLKSKVEFDPFGALRNWDAQDQDPCNWSGVFCLDGKVEILNLTKLSLRGTLTPELRNLRHLRFILLSDNHLFGVIPKEIQELTKLELLDLRNNNLSGEMPVEIENLSSLKWLLLCGNKIQMFTRSTTTIKEPSIFECDGRPPFDVVEAKGSIIGKIGEGLKLKMDLPTDSHVGNDGLCFPRFTKPYFVQNAQHIISIRRKLLEANNLPAISVTSMLPGDTVDVPSTGSGSFPAVPNPNGKKGKSMDPSVLGGIISVASDTPLPHGENNRSTIIERMGNWAYLILPGFVLLFSIVASLFLLRHRQENTTLVPWKTGISGQLQKALVTGVPRLNKSELEIACEDFSNIISTYSVCTVFKGTLSSGVEIAVISTIVASDRDWSKRAETCFRRKIDLLSRVNHKNFVNLLGYCEENEPFMRMMVFEFAPNGSLHDHLHVKEFEHLDWAARMRIIMGVVYCLQHMYHELNPLVMLSDLQSNFIFLTDDYAAKVMDIGVWREVVRRNLSGEQDINPSESPSTDLGSTIYNFGILLLEIISGKAPYTEEQGSLLNWATEYLNDNRNIKLLVDPTLKNFKDDDLEILCEIIQECVHPDPKHRPTFKEVASRLREVLAISPEAATPRLSPLWWAELEILSVEAS